MRFDSELKLAISAARAAGGLLMSFDPRKVDSQEGRDIKLRADRESEALILEHLKPSGLPTLSEESGENSTYTGGLRWVVDPLDGSFNFFKGLSELCCTSIALWDDETPVLGVVYRFALGEMLTGLVGSGAWRNDEPIAPSAVTAMDRACCATGLSVKGDFGRERLERYLHLLSKAKKVRMLGAAAIMSSSVACGRIDLYHEEDILLWDVAAGMALVRAAGGVTEYKAKADFKCDAACFANEELREAFHLAVDQRDAHGTF